MQARAQAWVTNADEESRPLRQEFSKLASLASEDKEVTRLRNQAISKQRTLSKLSAALRHRMCHDSVLTEMVTRADSAGTRFTAWAAMHLASLQDMGDPSVGRYCDQLAVWNAQIGLSCALIIRPRECLRSPLVDKWIVGMSCNV